LFFNNIRLKNQKYSSRDIYFGVEMKFDGSEEKVREIETFITERYKITRTEFETCARIHKDQINKLKKEEANENTLLEVYNLLPEYRSACRIQRTDMTKYPKYNRRVRSFNWIVVQKRYASTDKLPEDIAKTLKKDFKNDKDIRIMSVGSVGKMEAHLWLSGRITITLLGDKLIDGAMEIVKVSEKEVAPPYDFITL
jgi:hypothetical protein